jgi:hypothetical protein
MLQLSYGVCIPYIAQRAGSSASVSVAQLGATKLSREKRSSVGCSIAQHKAVGTTYLKRVHPSSVECIVALYISTA